MHIIGAPANVIGGGPATRNYIGGNGGPGIEIVGSLAVSNRVEGNYIGATPVGSAIANLDGGIHIGDSASDNVVGEPRGAAPAGAQRLGIPLM